MMVQVVLASILLAVQDPPKEDGAKKELEKLQGTWQCLSVQLNGKTKQFDQESPTRLVIKGNKGTWAGVEIWACSIDANTSPKLIDLKVSSGSDKGETREGIYALEKDTLKMCINLDVRGAKQRPSEFATKPDSKLVFYVFKRDKP